MSDFRIIDISADPSIKEASEELASAVDKLGGVIVLGLLKDGSPTITTSNMSGMQKAFLIQFLNAWAAQYFYKESGGV